MWKWFEIKWNWSGACDHSLSMKRCIDVNGIKNSNQRQQWPLKSFSKWTEHKGTKSISLTHALFSYSSLNTNKSAHLLTKMRLESEWASKREKKIERKREKDKKERKREKESEREKKNELSFKENCQSEQLKRRNLQVSRKFVYFSQILQFLLSSWIRPEGRRT